MMVAILGVLPRRSGEGEKYGTTCAFSMGRVFGVRLEGEDRLPVGYRERIGRHSRLRLPLPSLRIWQGLNVGMGWNSNTLYRPRSTSTLGYGLEWDPVIWHVLLDRKDRENGDGILGRNDSIGSVALAADSFARRGEREERADCRPVRSKQRSSREGRSACGAKPEPHR